MLLSAVMKLMPIRPTVFPVLDCDSSSATNAPKISSEITVDTSDADSVTEAQTIEPVVKKIGAHFVIFDRAEGFCWHGKNGRRAALRICCSLLIGSWLSEHSIKNWIFGTLLYEMGRWHDRWRHFWNIKWIQWTLERWWCIPVPRLFGCQIGSLIFALINLIFPVLDCDSSSATNAPKISSEITFDTSDADSVTEAQTIEPVVKKIGAHFVIFDRAEGFCWHGKNGRRAASPNGSHSDFFLINLLTINKYFKTRVFFSHKENFFLQDHIFVLPINLFYVCFINFSRFCK